MNPGALKKVCLVVVIVVMQVSFAAASQTSQEESAVSIDQKTGQRGDIEG